MKILSLFDGMSCGRLALEKAGIHIEKYYASEIDKYAIAVTQKNFPNTIQLGDVTKIDFTQFKDIDMIIGGSPCTSFSICGNREEFDGESKLFYDYVRAIRDIKPKYFFLENVESMSNEVKHIISKEMGCNPIMINSARVSAQQRKRYYWFNFGKQTKSLFGFPTCDIPQPKDKGIQITDILEDKENAIRTQTIKDTVRVGEFGNGGQSERIYMSCGKSACLGLGGSIKEWYCYPVKSNGNCIVKNGKALMHAEKYNITLPDGEYIVRRLSPLECERLQTVPDNYTQYGLIDGEVQKISDHQRYRMIGNAWTVDVIAHCFSYLKG